VHIKTLTKTINRFRNSKFPVFNDDGLRAEVGCQKAAISAHMKAVPKSE
jgi:hypothetical protein